MNLEKKNLFSFNLNNFFDFYLEKYKSLPMVENMKKILTYSEVDIFSRNFASYIQNFTNLKKGDRIAIKLPNILQYPVVLIGCIRAGLVVVNINPLYTEYEIEKHLENAKVKGIITLNIFAKKIEKLTKKFSIENVFITEMGDLLGFFKGNFVNFFLKKVKKIVPKFTISNFISFKKTIKKNFGYIDPKVDAQDNFCIQYTGGTTGILKGAILTHRNILSNVDQMYEILKNKIEEGKETVVTALPLYHIFAMNANFFNMIKVGAKNILITNPKNIKEFIKTIKNSKFSLFTGVATLFSAMMNEKSFKKIDFSKLKAVMSGGMSLVEKIASKWENITKVPIIEAYGLTEASPALISNRFDGNHRIGSVGLKLSETEIKILKNNDEIAEPNVPGRLFVKGPQVMKGYFENEEETKKVLSKDGWLYTGDIATMSEDGFVKIIDREKDMINISGFNVYPNEIENILNMHEGIFESSVVGVKFNEFRDDIKAFIVKKDNKEILESDLRNYCKKYLTSYKIPHHFIFVNSLPKSPVGKILKRLLV